MSHSTWIGEEPDAPIEAHGVGTTINVATRSTLHTLDDAWPPQ